MPRFLRSKHTDFGPRLAALREARGMSQRDLAKAIGTSQRTVSYYENESGYPQAEALAALAKVLGVGVDDLLGVTTTRKPLPTEKAGSRRLWEKFQVLADLPEKDQQAVLRLLNATAEARGIRTTA